VKVKNILAVTYGALITGIIIMVVAAVFVIQYEYMVIFMYLGGLLGVSGVVFCLIFLRYQPCQKCREYVPVQKQPSFKCPCCNKSLT